MSWDIVGHEWAVNLLQSHIQNGRVSHAYLFTGPQGLGRRTLALRFAQALICPQSDTLGIPCMKCQACLDVWQMRHADLHVVERHDGDRDIKVEAVRELQRSLSLAPYIANLRVALLLNFDEASRSAANALLKTLEEPASRVVLMLTAENPESLLPTVVSRCEVILLRPVPLGPISDHLQSAEGVPPQQAMSLAHFAGGRPGYAFRMHQFPELLDKHRQLLSDHYRMLSANRTERLQYAQAVSKDKDIFRHAMMVWQSFWREILMCALDKSSAPMNAEWGDEIRSLAESLGSSNACRAITSIERTITYIDRNVNIRLAAEALFLDLPTI